MFMQLPWDMVCSDKYIVNHHRKSGLEHPQGEILYVTITADDW